MSRTEILTALSTVVILIMGILDAEASGGKSIDLAGEWRVLLEGNSIVKAIMLPGTTDMAGLGTPDTLSPKLNKPQLLHLTRKNRYVGNASYAREIEIPQEMAGKPLRLRFERVMWKSRIEIDGKDTGQSRESLTTPHEFTLPEGLTAGKHTVNLHIDNSKQYEISYSNLAHSYTDDTQIMWNGVLGEMTMEVIPEIDLRNIQVYPDLAASELTVTADIDNHYDDTVVSDIKWTIEGLKGGGEACGKSRGHRLSPGENHIEFKLRDARLSDTKWSDLNPELLTLLMQADSVSDIKRVEFGMREIKAEGKKLMLNGNPIFLRGTLECCVFPLTGTPPTDEAGWEKVFRNVREWGLNHLRFHSWCPPEAAFKVADRMGFILQVECPLWSVEIEPGEKGANGEMKRFIRAEYDAIVRNYGNHPSFCLMTVGNELQKDFDWLNDMTAHMHSSDPRHLYASTSFTFEKGHGGHPEPNDDFIVTQWTDNGWVRGQGLFDKEPPSFDKNYNSSVDFIQVPLLEHEVGQYAVYPDLKEIEKYDGVLKPLNLMAVRDDLQSKGRLDRSGDYLRASGKLASILYKEEFERALKTTGVSGIQMLGLQDFPGQGTALVGLLNSFWESKGIVEPEWFRQFCGSIVPLADFEKAVYEWGDTFKAKFSVADYSDRKGEWTCCWRLSDGLDTVAEGLLTGDKMGMGLNELGSISVCLPDANEARKLKLTVSVNPGEASNSWNIWVYPKGNEIQNSDVIVTSDREVAKYALREGRKVFFSPDLDSISGTRSKFVPVFWSPVHFPKEAGAMGLVCNPQHPALAGFPNDGHTDWQWWYPLKRSTFMDVSDKEGITPIIEMVDNFTTNRALALVFETRIGNGSLIFSGIDLLSPGSNEPASRALLRSLLEYMKSDAFSPDTAADESIFNTFLRRK